MKQTREQSGRVSRSLIIVADYKLADSVRYVYCVVLLSATVAVVLIDPSVKMQEDPLRADWLSWKSGTRHNSFQITP